jgi:hypothetical protein
MPQYVQGQPQSGALYQRLQMLIAANYSGLGPNNVGSNPYSGMTGQAFQKPLSRSSTQFPPIHTRTSW